MPDLDHNPILFPQNQHGPEMFGAELRDWFAANAMRTAAEGEPDPRIAARRAYEAADAMLTERKRWRE